MLSLASNQKKKGCREVNSWEARGEHQEGRCQKNGRGRQKEGGSQESDVYLKKEIATCWEDLDKLKGHSILERQLEWREDTEQAQCWEQICKNVTPVWYTVLIWKTWTLSWTVQKKEFGKSSALTIRKPAFQVPGSSYNTNNVTGEQVQKVLHQKNTGAHLVDMLLVKCSSKQHRGCLTGGN